MFVTNFFNRKNQDTKITMDYKEETQMNKNI